MSVSNESGVQKALLARNITENRQVSHDEGLYKAYARNCQEQHGFHNQEREIFLQNQQVQSQVSIF